MGYLVLARKWRPQGFEDIIGQQSIIRILVNSISQGKISHAYVFSGPRGVGKTSAARILAKGLNCSSVPTSTPCGKCDSCISITEGNSVDVMEIDGASNNSVDDIRDLRERVKYAPSSGMYKVYIIDEAHMLSTSAFNALLKTLEEPPPHVVFVLATTESRKIPLTVMSRCQHLPFRRISLSEIKDRLMVVAKSEGIAIPEQALSIIARAADGSIRDSLTILDQVASFSDKITDDDVKGLLDIEDFKSLAEMAEALIDGGKEIILERVAGLIDRGTDLRAYTKDLIGFFRDLLVIKITRSDGQEFGLNAEELGMLKKIASGVPEEYLILIISELIKSESEVRTSFSPRVALEMALIRISLLNMFKSVNEALSTLTRERTSSSGRRSWSESGSEKKGIEAGSDMSKKSHLDEPLEHEPPVGSSIEEPTHDGSSLLKAIVEKMADAKHSSYLSMAKAELNDNTLLLIFNSNEADICAKPFMDNPEPIEKIASELMGKPIRLEVKTRHVKTISKKDLKNKVLSEPVIKEALDLFEGRVVDVKQAKET